MSKPELAFGISGAPDGETYVQIDPDDDRIKKFAALDDFEPSRSLVEFRIKPNTRVVELAHRGAIVGTLSMDGVRYLARALDRWIEIVGGPLLDHGPKDPDPFTAENLGPLLRQLGTSLTLVHCEHKPNNSLGWSEQQPFECKLLIEGEPDEPVGEYQTEAPGTTPVDALLDALALHFDRFGDDQ